MDKWNCCLWLLGAIKMSFKDFINSKKVRTANVDISMIKGVIKLVKNDLDYLDSLEVNRASSRRLVVSYYDLLRETLELLAIKNGFKIYEHEAFTFFLKEINEEPASIKFDRLRKIRNKINYYGQYVGPEEASELIEDIRSLIISFLDKYFKDLE